MGAAMHVSREQLDLLRREKLAPAETRRVVRHLLSGCDACLALARTALLPDRHDLDYTGLLRRLELALLVADNEVRSERAHAEDLWPVLKPLAPERRLFLVKHDPRFQSWGVYEKLLEEARTAGREDPIQAVDLAHLALGVAEMLDGGSYGEERIADFRAAAYVALGNAKRLLGDLQGAEAALAAAEGHLRQGTGDPLEAVNLISIQSSLQADLGFLEEATALLDRAGRHARATGDRHLEGRIALKQSSFIGYVDPQRGLALAEQGLSLLESGKDPHLDLVGRHLLAFWSNAVGDPEEAEGIVDTYRYLYAQFSDTFWTGRLLHLEGNIARTRGDLRKAERCFRGLVDLYSRKNFELDLVLAALDLSEVLVRQGSPVEASQILSELHPILEAWKLSGDILRAWTILLAALRENSFEERAFQEVAMLLRRRWNWKE